MGKPNLETPVTILVLVANSVARWRTDNDEVLKELDEEEDFSGKGRNLSAGLRAADSNLTKEQRESVAATGANEAQILAARKVVKAVEAGAERAFKNHSKVAFADVRRDFVVMRGSQIRSVPTALRALKVARVGVQSHQEVLDGGKIKRSGKLLAQIEAAEQAVLTASDDTTRESQESQKALRAREDARAEVLNYIEDALLMAEEAAATDDSALVDLHRIFDKILPPPSTPAAATDDAPATPTEPAPTV